MSEIFHNMKNELIEKGDDNYCVPIALSVFLGEDVHEINNELIRKGLREKGEGVYNYHIYQFLSNKGEVENVTNKVLFEHNIRTVRTLSRNLNPNLEYFIQVRGHVLAAKDGTIHDWSKNRCSRIVRIYVKKDRDLNEPIIVKKKRSKSKRLTKTEKEKIRVLLKSGISIQRIANNFNVSYATIYYHFKKLKGAKS